MDDYFAEWDAYALQRKLKQRALNLEHILASSKLKIVALTGIRRSGKTSILILLRQMVKGKAAYVNLEDSRLKNTPNILDELLKWFGDEGYLFLDEITNVPGWQGWLARVHEMLKGKLHLILSSSRHSLVIPQKPLRGRMISQEMFPLSFREFLTFQEIRDIPTTAGLGIKERALATYAQYGGFPEVTEQESNLEMTRLLGSYFQDIIGLDVADAAGETITTVELFGKYALESSYFSASKCLNFMKSVGHKIGKQSILTIERFAQEGYLFFFVPVYSPTIKDRTQYPRKVYAGDTGFPFAITGKTDWGKLYENLVYLELRRRSINEKICYFKDKDGREADFLLLQGLSVKEIIQVVYEMDFEKTKEREISGIISAAHVFGKKQGIIITKDFAGRETRDGVKITYIPLWKWLLQK